MRYPAATGQDLAGGWRIDPIFLRRIKSAAATFYDPLDMDLEEIQSVLLAATIWESFAGTEKP